MHQAVLKEKFKKATELICKQGLFPLPANETALEIVKKIVGNCEDELDLIYAFRSSPSQTSDQLIQSSGMKKEQVERLSSSLAKKGIVFNQPASSGIMIYRLLPLVMIGVMEYKFMTPITGSEEERELALLFEQLLEQLRDQVQNNYDTLAPAFEKAPAVDRTIPTLQTDTGTQIKIIPIDKTLDNTEEFILPSQNVEEIIRKFDDIAVGYCFCRQRRELLGKPCATHAPTLNCFTFGKSARHTIAQGFAKKVSREEALQIMRDAEKAGLIHKAFHPGSKESKPETSICNCCKDCCDTLVMWREGTTALINSTYYLSMIDVDLCSGCGTCEERCPTEAIQVSDEGVAIRDESACFGCGICARFCPEDAISLKEGLRRVFIMPPRLR